MLEGKKRYIKQVNEKHPKSLQSTKAKTSEIAPQRSFQFSARIEEY
jgi:hypothetical protein